MEKEKNDAVSMMSLNEGLNSEFSIQELEQRLETNPLFLSNPTDVSVQMSADCFDCTMCFSCGEF